MRADSKHDPVEVSFPAKSEACLDGGDWLAVLVFDSRCFLFPEGGENLRKLIVKLNVAIDSGRFNRQLREDRLGLIFSSVFEEPSGRLGAEEDEEDGRECESDLDSEGYAELSRGVDKAEAIVDPVCGHLEALSPERRRSWTTTTYHTENVDGQLDCQCTTSIVRFRRLRVPDRDGRCVDTVSESCDDSANDELRDTKRSDLEHGSDRQHCTAEHDCSSTSKLFTVEEREQRPKETPDLVDRDDCPLQRG